MNSFLEVSHSIVKQWVGRWCDCPRSQPHPAAEAPSSITMAATGAPAPRATAPVAPAPGPATAAARAPGPPAAAAPAPGPAAIALAAESKSPSRLRSEVHEARQRTEHGELGSGWETRVWPAQQLQSAEVAAALSLQHEKKCAFLGAEVKEATNTEEIFKRAWQCLGRGDTTEALACATQLLGLDRSNEKAYCASCHGGSERLPLRSAGLRMRVPWFPIPTSRRIAHMSHACSHAHSTHVSHASVAVVVPFLFRRGAGTGPRADTRAVAYARSAQWRFALADYSCYLRLHQQTSGPALANALYGRALCLAKLGERRAALRDLDECIKVGPEDEQVTEDDASLVPVAVVARFALLQAYPELRDARASATASIATSAAVPSSTAHDDSTDGSWSAAVDADVSRYEGAVWRVLITDLEVALARACRSGKTPLLLDQTAEKAVDAYYLCAASRPLAARHSAGLRRPHSCLTHCLP